MDEGHEGVCTMGNVESRGEEGSSFQDEKRIRRRQLEDH